MRLALVGMLVTGAACTEPNPRSCLDGTCTSEEFPFCDVDGTFGETHTPQTCIAVTCEASSFAGCRGDTELRCNSEGTNYDLVDCPLGCQDDVGCRACSPNETVCANGVVQSCDAEGHVMATETCGLGCFDAEPRCRRIAPSNFSTEIMDMARSGPDLDLPMGLISADTGSIYDGHGQLAVPSVTLSVPNAPPLRIFLARSARLGDVAVQGTYAVAIATELPLEITGRLEVASGTGDARHGCDAGPAIFKNNLDLSSDTMASSGSGGGGNATAGGKGGTLSITGQSSDYVGGSAGSAVGNDVLIPLQGGCGDGGGHGVNGPTPVDYPRGPGGGAIQLVSQTEVHITGIVDVRGPRGTVEQVQEYLVVYGGGAGGSVLIEAPTVTLGPSAKIIAKGGGGGSAGNTVTHDDSESPELGAASSGPYAAGGNGGTATSAPTDGAAYTRPSAISNGCGGGGGGSVGRLRVNAKVYQKDGAARELAKTTTGTPASR